MESSGQVFLSHTSVLRELPRGRSFVDAAEYAVSRAGGVPVDMARFTADPRPPAQVCREAVRSADVFVGIVGSRYGSLVHDCPELLSYTELEFEEAGKAGLPRLMFVLGEETQGPAELFRDIEHGACQEVFRNSLRDSGVTTATVTSPEGLSEALYQALVGAPTEELAQRAFMAEPHLPDKAPPSFLLRSDYKVVRFHGRHRELAELTAWCASDDDMGVRLCTGPGGQGKTRLALEMIARMTPQGWTAGRLLSSCDEQTLQELCRLKEDTLLVVDYAETQPELLATLFELAGQRAGGAGRLRLLLLARSATEWWSQRCSFVVSDRVRVLLYDAEYELPVLFDRAEERPGMFASAVLALAKAGGFRAEGLTPPENLAEDRFASALTLHMTALAALLDHQESQAPSEAYRDPAGRVLEHEQRYWSRAARAVELPHAQPRLLQAVMTAITCCGASSRDEAVDLVGCVPDLEGKRRPVLCCYADWAHQLHPGEDWLNPLVPDLLGERLVADTLASQPELAAAMGRAVSKPAQQLSLCTVLGRAAVQHETVRAAIPRILTAGSDMLWLAAATVVSYLPRPDILGAALIDSVGGVSDRDVLWAAASSMPRSHRNCDLKIAVAEEALRRFGDAAERNEIAEADLRASLAGALFSANRFEELLEQLRQAADLYRELAREKPGQYVDKHLSELSNYATQLDNLGHHRDALKVCNEVLAAANRYGRSDNSYVRVLVLSCRSSVFKHRKRPGKALKAMIKAVEECRVAAMNDEQASAWLPMTIMNLANRYSELGRHEEALTTIEEAVEKLREQERARPDPLRPNLAQALINYSQCLYDSGQALEGRTVIVEAVQRLLRVTEHRSPHLPMMWNALGIWHTRLHSSDFTDEAVRAEYEQLVTIHLREDWPTEGRRAETAATAMMDYAIKLADAGDTAAGNQWQKRTFTLQPGIEMSMRRAMAERRIRLPHVDDH